MSKQLVPFQATKSQDVRVRFKKRRSGGRKVQGTPTATALVIIILGYSSSYAPACVGYQKHLIIPVGLLSVRGLYAGSEWEAKTSIP